MRVLDIIAHWHFLAVLSPGRWSMGPPVSNRCHGPGESWDSEATSQPSPASIDRPDRTSCSSSLSRRKSSSKLFIVVCGGIEGRLRYGRDGVSLAAGRGGGRIRSSTGTGFLVGLCAGCLFKKRPALPPQSNHMYPPWNDVETRGRSSQTRVHMQMVEIRLSLSLSVNKVATSSLVSLPTHGG